MGWRAEEFAQVVGVPAYQLAENLLNAFDEDVLTTRAREQFHTQEPTAQLQTVQRRRRQAAAPFCRPEVRDFIENVRRSHEQIIDNTNPDSLLFVGFDAQKEETADRVIRPSMSLPRRTRTIIVLRILYSQTYQTGPWLLNSSKTSMRSCEARA
ncbi:MAG: hypothetical protein ACLSB9_35240 [Hydrogeniiclostridium mannosilyticum]